MWSLFLICDVMKRNPYILVLGTTGFQVLLATNQGNETIKRLMHLHRV